MPIRYYCFQTCVKFTHIMQTLMRTAGDGKLQFVRGDVYLHTFLSEIEQSQQIILSCIPCCITAFSACMSCTTDVCTSHANQRHDDSGNLPLVTVRHSPNLLSQHCVECCNLTSAIARYNELPCRATAALSFLQNARQKVLEAFHKPCRG